MDQLNFMYLCIIKIELEIEILLISLFKMKLWSSIQNSNWWLFLKLKWFENLLNWNWYPFVFTEDVHEGEGIVEGDAHEESGKGEEAERRREGRDDSGQGARQIAEDQGRNAAESVGDVAQDDPADDAPAKEEGLSQRSLTGLIAHPIILNGLDFWITLKSLCFHTPP